MIACIEDGKVMDLNTLKKHDIRGILDLKRWARMKDDLHIVVTDRDMRFIVLKDGLRLACIEDWEGIVLACHSSGHLGLEETSEKIKSTWCTNIRQHGIPLPYVRRTWLVHVGV